MKVFAQYGIFIGLLLYALLFYSSIKISRTCWVRQRYAFAIALLVSSISYPVFGIPLFTAFWLYGLFGYEEDELPSEDADYADEDDEGYEGSEVYD